MVRDTESGSFEDLKDIMLWPRSLTSFETALSDTEDSMRGIPIDTSELTAFLPLQSQSLQRLVKTAHPMLEYIGTLGTTLRQFPNLKYISLPRSFLARLESDPPCNTYDPDNPETSLNRYFSELYLALPAALEELILNINVDFLRLSPTEDVPEPLPIWSIRDVAKHKEELYPSLRRIVLWRSLRRGESLTGDEITRHERRMIQCYGVSEDVKNVNVEFKYKVTNDVPCFRF